MTKRKHKLVLLFIGFYALIVFCLSLHFMHRSYQVSTGERDHLILTPVIIPYTPQFFSRAVRAIGKKNYKKLSHSAELQRNKCGLRSGE